MASTASSSSATAAVSSSAKRKAATADSAAVAANVTPIAAPPSLTGLSPYAAKNTLINHYSETATAKSPDDKYVVVRINDHVLNLIPGKKEKLYDEYSVDCLSELSETQLKQVYAKLTQGQVDKYHHLMIVPESAVKLLEKHTKAIQYSDRRFNDPDDDDSDDGGCAFLMFNTYSSHLMVGVIQSQITAALREVNKATKAVKSADNVIAPGIASEAFKHVFAATFAADEIDHWRHDTEDPESVARIGKKIEKLFRDLLCFTDGELGLVDPYTRGALLQKIDDMSKGWKSDCSDWCPKNFGIKVRMAKNGQGLGRPGAAAQGAASSSRSAAAATVATTPASKKAKTGGNTATAAAVSPDASTSGILSKFLSAMDEKIKQRVKTNLQLKITSRTDTTKSVLVVVSGATDIKKMNQICAYLTGHDSTFQYHSQKGKCLKGSRIELFYKDEKMWLAEKAASRKAQAAGATHVVDKSVKIVQLFQGLNVNHDDGIFYDSELAKDIAATPGSVAWVSPDDEPYDITAQCIVARKVLTHKDWPLPRIVSVDNELKCSRGSWKNYDMGEGTGFGMNIASSNRYMQGDREGPSMWVMGSPSRGEMEKRAAIQASRPLCDSDGSSIDCVGEDRNGDLFYLMPHTRKDLESACLPSDGGVRADGASFVFGNGKDAKAMVKKGK